LIAHGISSSGGRQAGDCGLSGERTALREVRAAGCRKTQNDHRTNMQATSSQDTAAAV